MNQSASHMAALQYTQLLRYSSGASVNVHINHQNVEKWDLSDSTKVVGARWAGFVPFMKLLTYWDFSHTHTLLRILPPAWSSSADKKWPVDKRSPEEKGSGCVSWQNWGDSNFTTVVSGGEEFQCTTGRTARQMVHNNRRARRLPLSSAENRSRRLRRTQAHSPKLDSLVWKLQPG